MSTRLTGLMIAVCVALASTGTMAAERGPGWRVPFFGHLAKHFSKRNHRHGVGFGPEVRPGERVSTGDMLNDRPLPPRDVYRPSGRRGAAHVDLGTFAWLEFIALNAPVGDRRGTPGGSFADSGHAPDATLVWETYQHRSELLPYSAAGPVPPQPWDSTPTYVYQVTNGGTTTSYTPLLHNYNNLDETSQIGQNLAFFPHSGGDAQVLFQAKANEVEWSFIDRNYDGALTNVTRDPTTHRGTLIPPITLPDGVIEVKSAWRPIESIPEAERYRYHTSQVIFYDGDDDNPVAHVGTYALIALHIIHKTRNYPTFVFTTFEHVDILTKPDTSEPTGFYYVPTYDVIEYETSRRTTFAPTGESYRNPFIGFDVDDPMARPNGMTVDLPLGLVTSIDGATIESDRVHVPIVQPPTTNAMIDEANRRVLKAMSRLPGFDDSFVWQYYRLKGVQAVPTSRDSAPDFYLANIAVESSQPGIQLFRGGVSVAPHGEIPVPVYLTNQRNMANVQDPKQHGRVFSMGGCQGCHGVAQTQAGFDFSFLFDGVNGFGFSPDTIGFKSRAVERLRLQSYRNP